MENKLRGKLYKGSEEEDGGSAAKPPFVAAATSTSDGGGDDHHGAGSHQRAHHISADDLALAAGERDDPAGHGGLPEIHVGDDAAAAEDGDAAVAMPREGGDGLHDITPTAYLHHVAPQRVGTLLRHHNRRLRLVL
nr:hypothetical protein TorRG33x02_270040 [Ipomoea batatas]